MLRTLATMISRLDLSYSYESGYHRDTNRDTYKNEEAKYISCERFLSQDF